MKKSFKILLFSVLLIVMLSTLTGCMENNPNQNYTTTNDVSATLNAGDKLSKNQPTPTDIDYSLERYNLIKRTYWVNGEREKAKSLPCQVNKPLGYIALFLDNGSCVGKFIVDGKISSLNSYLTPDSEYYERSLGEYYDSKRVNKWLPDVDGSYGENDEGIFFFTPDGKYVEWSGTYLYSDIPFEINDVVVQYKEVE